MEILSEMLTDKLWRFSENIGYVVAITFVVLAVASHLHDDRSIRRLIVAILGLVISVAIIGQQILNPDEFVFITLTVVSVMIVTSLLFELVPFLDNRIGQLSRLVSKITRRTGIYTATIITFFILPFSYLYLYGLSYPPCGLNVAHANFIGSEIPAFKGNQVVYLTWTKGGRPDHVADFCAPVFDGTKGEIAETFFPEVYENNRRHTSGYRMESPIEQGEYFKIVSVVSVECGAGACRDFDEGMFYVLQNSSSELWVASADAMTRLR